MLVFPLSMWELSSTAWLLARIMGKRQEPWQLFIVAMVGAMKYLCRDTERLVSPQTDRGAREEWSRVDRGPLGALKACLAVCNALKSRNMRYWTLPVETQTVMMLMIDFIF